MNEPEPLQLGDTARDTVTGLTGTVVHIGQWLGDLPCLTVQPTELGSDGKPIPQLCCTEARWERVGAAVEACGFRRAGTR